MYSIETFLIFDLVKMFFFHLSNIFRKKDFRLTCASFAEITISAASLCSKNFVPRDWGIGKIFISGIGDFSKAWDLHPRDFYMWRLGILGDFLSPDFLGMGIFFRGMRYPTKKPPLILFYLYSLQTITSMPNLYMNAPSCAPIIGAMIGIQKW